MDWSSALSGWSWLVPPEFTLWLVNRFCDLFLVVPDGSVHILDVGSGILTRLADDRDDFSRRIDEGNNAADWLMIPLVDELAASGLSLQRSPANATASNCRPSWEASTPSRTAASFRSSTI